MQIFERSAEEATVRQLAVPCFRATRIARARWSTKSFDLRLPVWPHGEQGGAAPSTPPRDAALRITMAFVYRSSSVDCSFDIPPSASPALRLSALGIFRDIAQDELRKLHNQLFETRYFLPAPRQLALFICHS